jgi:energy-coupling factor transporter ATP-binding protein EcfA2
MSNIDKVRIHNFKAFYTGSEPDEIDLGGKHLLMYGENGSGKSSIYWALYTLFQSETKQNIEINKYFTPTHDEQLLNFTYLNQRPDFVIDVNGKITNPTDIGKNAEVEVILKDTTSLKINKDGKSETLKNKLEELNRHSDFITHRLLVNFYNFRNSKEINLWEVFVRDFFPFLKMDKNKSKITLWQKLKEIENNMPFNVNDAAGTFKRSKSKVKQKWMNDEITAFNSDLEYWIGRINVLANIVYKEELKIKDNIEIFLKYDEPFRYDHYKDNEYVKDGKKYIQGTGYAAFNHPILKLQIKRMNDDGTYSLIHRPQAYLNEAKITQIALSIRFSLLDKTIKPDYPGQFLALDDLLISLDMGNRDIVLDAILNIYAKRFKIYIFTHEKSFFDFCVFKIEQRKQKKDWEIMEIHSNDLEGGKPVIIPSVLNPYDKAKKYFSAKDYTTASLYLRKELEKLVIERLPEEYTKTIDGQFHNLEHYWKLFIERYQKLGKVISDDIKEYFKQSKLLILNPAAHHNLNLPVYKLELERAFKLVEKIYDEYPIPKLNILLTKGMTLVFKHPTENYSFEFLLEGDLSINSIDSENEVTTPKCKIMNWQFKGVDLWDFRKNNISNYNVTKKPMLDNFDKVIKTHIQLVPLSISAEMFLNNTNIKYTNSSINDLLINNGIYAYFNFVSREIVFELI